MSSQRIAALVPILTNLLRRPVKYSLGHERIVTTDISFDAMAQMGVLLRRETGVAGCDYFTDFLMNAVTDQPFFSLSRSYQGSGVVA